MAKCRLIWGKVLGEIVLKFFHCLILLNPWEPLFIMSLTNLSANKTPTSWPTLTPSLPPHFHDPVIQANIKAVKEEQYQEGFLKDLFVAVFGYTLNPRQF